MARIIVALLLATSAVGCGVSVDATEPLPAPQAEAPAVEPVEEVVDGPTGLAARGKELALDTHRLLPDYVGNGLNCTNCHLEGGTVPKAAPWIGVTDRYPRYRARSGKIDDLPDRINGCMERSMAGTALPRDSEPMQAMVAYMTWLSEGIEDGKKVDGIGMPRIESPEPPDPQRGEALFAAKCASCHQPEGQGMFAPDDATLFPPLSGPRSYNIAAGMARQNTAAAFVKWNMPLGQGGTLSDQESHDLAAYFTRFDRPDFARKAADWPKGDKPVDARY